MEQDFKSFRREINEIKNKSNAGLALEYEDALDEIRKHLNEKLHADLTYGASGPSSADTGSKAYLRKKKEEYTGIVSDIMNVHSIRVKGYGPERMREFAAEVASEIVGFDILEDAFQNPEVSDIYVLDWKTIFVEESGENRKYHRSFRTPQHFKNFLFRLLNSAGKELNSGESKKADFELYGDRYCATSPSISPRGFSLTIRKHAEDHVTFDQILDQGILSREMAALMGLFIKGERNLVYAGLTGSGKTTSIRAFLDHFVTSLNKRMLVCEDTQELFPKNEHTLELVSSLTSDPKTEVTLQQLVYTSLRLKPKYIVIGEVRAEEAQAASEAMETGHSTIFTMHGGRAINCVNRIVTKYLTSMPSLGIEVVERIIGSSIDYICIQDNIPGIGRKITEISEVSYDYEKRTVCLVPIYKYDFHKNDFVQVNPISEEKAEMMMRRGVTYEELHPWLEKEEL